MHGLSGQSIDWSGVDGGWYSLVKDEEDDIHINVRLTAPLPVEFPNRQLTTGVAILSGGHSLVIEVKNPYTAATGGCPNGVSPCLADGGLRVTVDQYEDYGLLSPVRDGFVADGIHVSASNLPVECRQFGGDRIWARMYAEMLHGRRHLQGQSFEDWVLMYEAMAAPAWCTKYIAENGLQNVQSNYAIFKVVTPTVVVRLHTGVSYQGGGEKDWDGRVLPDLDFWQMDIGVGGLNVGHRFLSGILGETARPVFDDEGRAVMKGQGAMRGKVSINHLTMEVAGPDTPRRCGKQTYAHFVRCKRYQYFGIFTGSVLRGIHTRETTAFTPYDVHSIFLCIEDSSWWPKSSRFIFVAARCSGRA